MENENNLKRTRVNFKTSVKGVVTPDVTLEMFDTDNSIIMREIDELLEGSNQLAKAYTLLNSEVTK